MNDTLVTDDAGPHPEAPTTHVDPYVYQARQEFLIAKARYKGLRPWWLRKRFWALAVVVFLIIGSAITGDPWFKLEAGRTTLSAEDVATPVDQVPPSMPEFTHTPAPPPSEPLGGAILEWGTPVEYLGMDLAPIEFLAPAPAIDSMRHARGTTPVAVRFGVAARPGDGHTDIEGIAALDLDVHLPMSGADHWGQLVDDAPAYQGPADFRDVGTFYFWVDDNATLKTLGVRTGEGQGEWTYWLLPDPSVVEESV